MIYMKTSLNIYGKDQTTPNKTYSLPPLTQVPPPFIVTPSSLSQRLVQGGAYLRDLPPFAIYTFSFLCCVCVPRGIVPSSLRQGQFSTFPWLESAQSTHMIYTIQGSACQCLQCVGVDFLGRNVLRNGPHQSKLPISAPCVYQITPT